MIWNAARLKILNKLLRPRNIAEVIEVAVLYSKEPLASIFTSLPMGKHQQDRTQTRNDAQKRKDKQRALKAETHRAMNQVSRFFSVTCLTFIST